MDVDVDADVDVDVDVDADMQCTCSAPPAYMHAHLVARDRYQTHLLLLTKLLTHLVSRDRDDDTHSR